MGDYELLAGSTGVPIKAWIRGVPLEAAARAQLENVARLPFVYQWIAAMPDVHFGIGATVGSVIPTLGAIVPAAVGVDIGCGMMAVQTSLNARDLPDDLKGIRARIERAVPHGQGGAHKRRDHGSWHDPPPRALAAWRDLGPRFAAIQERHRAVDDQRPLQQLGTLGGGNHFVEVCIDERDGVWLLLHSGSRGTGNRLGTHFIALAKQDLGHALGSLPDRDLAYFEEGSAHFAEYVAAVHWAQDYARANREVMMAHLLETLQHEDAGLPPFRADLAAVNCHHNYVAKETHYGREVLVTRKGAVRAGQGELGIIPGSMGARSFIVRGKGHPESFESCSHGAGRAMSRGEAKRRFSLADHEAATRGVECRKDAGVLDETPAAYKSIDAVMAAQAELVEVVHTLKQVVCVKG